MTRLSRKYSVERYLKDIFFPSEEVKAKRDYIRKMMDNHLEGKPIDSQDTVTVRKPDDYR